jgi:peptidoglycan hydrolase-like protein with peptidoglycan-binding domain
MIMYDTIKNSAYPAGMMAGAAYIDGGEGDQPNYAAVRAAHPGIPLLSIALDAAHDADCLDMESGAAAPVEFPGWWARQRARGISRPCGYASASPMTVLLLPHLANAGILRREVRLWSAHTGHGAHICGPLSCGEVPINVDGTQWLQGNNLDQSLLLDTFFTAAVVPPPLPLPKWQVQMMQALPWVQQGAADPAIVRTIQGLCAARSVPLVIDGTFGRLTTLAVKAVQLDARLKPDGIVGPATWPALMGVA